MRRLIGKERSGAEEESGGRDVAGNSGFDGVKLLAAGDGDGILCPLHSRSEGAERELAMIAGANVFANNRGSLRL